MCLFLRIPVIILTVTFGLLSKTVILNDSTMISCTPKTGEFSCRSLMRLIDNRSDPQLYLKNHLDSLGYFNQKWDTLTIDSIMVETGHRSIIAQESFSGLDSTMLPGLPPAQLPRLYDAGMINKRADQICRFLAEKGFPFSSIEINIEKISENSSQDSLMITFNIETDQLYLFSTSPIHGSITTSKKIILKDILFKEGEPYNIKKVEESEKRLRSRFYIEEAQASPPIIVSGEQNRSDSNQNRVIVPFSINDRSGLGLEGVAGFEANQGEGPRFYGNLTFSLINLFHTGEAVSFEYSGDKSQQRLKLDITKPWFFNYPVTVGAGMDLEVVNEEYGYLGGEIKLLSEAGSNWKIGVGVNAFETTPSQDSTGEYGTFYGADFILTRAYEEYLRGQFAKELYLKTGSGIARKAINFSRSHFDFAGGIHIPLFWNQAIVSRVISKHLITNEKKLIAAEMYRVGGHNSLRGYSDKEFSFRTVLYGQMEYLLYFKRAGSVYIFTDGGIGFDQQIDLQSPGRQLMMGYGLGVRIPSRVANLNLEWARNYREREGLGRIHIRIQNALANVSHKLPFGF